jgi:hypothetical protein
VGGIFTFIDYRVLTCKCCVVHVLWLADGKQTETRCNGRARSYEKETSAARNTSGPFALLLSLYVVSLYLQHIYSRSCSVVTFRSLACVLAFSSYRKENKQSVSVMKTA